MENPTLNIALFVASDDEAIKTVAHKVGASIKNGGKVIYNGNDETVEVPDIFNVGDMHKDFIGDEKSFAGWTDAEKVTMIDFGKRGTDMRQGLLEEHLDAETVRFWQEHRDEFDSNDVIAIHVDTSNGSWFEYIMNGTQPPLDIDE